MVKVIQILVLFGCVGYSSAFTLPFSKRSSAHSTSVQISSSKSQSSTASGDEQFGFTAHNDGLYTAMITVSGTQFSVVVDTGSADLFLDTKLRPISGFKDTGVNGSVGYLDGSGASGHIILVNLSIGEFTIPQQALIDAPGSASSDASEEQGLMGVGMPSSSTVKSTLQNSSFDGSTLLDNIFSLYPDEPNYTTFLLARNQVGAVDGGVFTIGEVDPDHKEILNEPELKPISDNDWDAITDGMFVNGVFLYGGSNGFPNVPDAKVLSTLDSGTSFGAAPPGYVQALYSKLPGATFDGKDTWTVPCDAKINASMVFNGKQYPIHPIDLTVLSSVNPDGSVVCHGTYSESHQDTGRDFLLGDYFLRNVYVLYDFGNRAKTGATDPFMRVLSVTDPDQAWAEFDSMNALRIQQFVAARTGKSTASGSGKEAVAGSLSSAPTSSPASVNWNAHALLRNTYIIIGMAGATVVLLIVLVVASASKTCVNNKKHRIGSRGSYRNFSPAEKYSAPYSD